MIGGQPANALPPGQRRVAMVFETGALIPFLDVATNMGWGLRARHVPQPEVDRRVAGRAGQFRLGRLLRRRPDQLSEGERGLVGIGRALVQTPRAFLLDEPLAHLDAAERVRVRRRIVEVVRSLSVTHPVRHPRPGRGARRRRPGRAAARGHGAAGRPTRGPCTSGRSSLLAAASVGPIGLVPARLVVADGLAGYQVGRHTLPLWGPAPSEVDDRRPLVLGFRPEDVRPGDPSADTVGLEAVVTAAEYLGRNQAVTLAVGAPPVTAPGAGLAAPGGATLRALWPPREPVRAGDATRVAVDARRAHVFDGITGVALHSP